MKKIIISLIILSFVIAAVAYYNIDGDIVASHWNAAGEVDGYMPAFWGFFLFPIILVFLYLMFLFIPKIDPLKKNIEKFRKYYDWFVLIIIVFMFYVFILTILFNFYKFNMTTMMMPALALLFFLIGMFMKKLKRNWFMGIRTPWTISSDKVWDKTHLLGGKLFMLSSVFIIVGMFFPRYIVWFVLLPILTFTLWLVVYSYLEFRKIK